VLLVKHVQHACEPPRQQWQERRLLLPPAAAVARVTALLPLLP
jgi:hypothetical protein